jgi:hypothetical protein
MSVKILILFYKKKQWRQPSKMKKRGKNPSPRDRKVFPSLVIPSY